MYAPVLNSEEKARELIDVVREQTDAPIDTCINTVSIILSSLLRDLPDAYNLHVIKNALEKDDIIDLDNCYDAKVLEQLTANIISHIADKELEYAVERTLQIDSSVVLQLDYSTRNDETMMVTSLQQFAGFLKKADVRVSIKRFRQDDYAFIEQLVSLYQMELRNSVRIELLSTFHSLCLLDRSVITMLLCGKLPVLLVLHNNFRLPLTELDVLSLKLLTALFSTGEQFPTLHYDALNLEFLTKIVSIIEDSLDAFQFLLSFNAHFELNESIVIQALHNNPPLTFGQLLTMQLNQCRADNKDLRAVKLLMDIFCVSEDLVSVLFYDNDLKVLYRILCQDLIDTNQPQKMAMILEIMKNMEVVRRCGFTREIFASVKTFLLTHETKVELRLCAESILERATERYKLEKENEDNGAGPVSTNDIKEKVE
uniref:SPIN90/Ldb17 leucine-rich domain-containing protein n=1 Tax=Setaria digitata TaxID=48799 RepID=A0A915PN03_9BILA